MKNTIMVIGLLMVAGIGLAAPASASNNGYQGDRDAYAFTQDLREGNPRDPDNVTYTGTVAHAQQMANTICDWRAKGFSQSALSDGYVWQWLGDPQPTADNPDGLAIAVVYGAEWHFCPAYFVPPWVS
jgi:hypothetical protein